MPNLPRNILITGVSSGLGLGFLKACLGRGDAVFGIGRRPPPDMAGVPGVRFVPCDLSEFAAVPGCLDDLLLGTGTIDLVILNAGILAPIADLADTPMETLQRLMDVNCFANKAVLDALFQGGGKGGRQVDQVVAVSSGAAVSGARGWNGYSISKAALNMLIRLYAAERPGTHFSSLAPGLIDTAMQEQLRKVPADPRYPVVERLKQAQGTPDMPGPDEAAVKVLAAMDRVRSLKSGDFYDIRSLH